MATPGSNNFRRVSDQYLPPMMAVAQEALTGVDPEAVDKDRPKPVDVLKWFKEQMRLCWDRHKYAQWAYNVQGIANTAYYIGEQRIRALESGQIHFLPQTEDDRLYVLNALSLFSDDVTSSFVQMNPQLLFTVLHPEERVRRSQLRAANSLSIYLNRLLFPEAFRQPVAKNGQFWGDYCAELYWDDKATKGQEWYEEYEQAVAQLPPTLECQQPGCGAAQFTKDNAPTYCPACGSFNTKVTPGGQQRINQLQASGWRAAGEPVLREIVAGSQRYSFLTGAALSPYRIIQEDLPAEYAEARWGRGDGVNPSMSKGLDVDYPMRTLRNAGINSNNRENAGSVAGAESENIYSSKRGFFEPEMMHYVCADKDTVMPSGMRIPAGTRLSEVWDQGICVIELEGRDDIVEDFPCSHRTRFFDQHFSVLPGKKHGRSISDARVYQGTLNIIASAEITRYRKQALPSIAVNSRVFRNAQLFNNPGNAIMSEEGALKENESIGNQFAYVQANNSPSEQGMALLGMVKDGLQGAMRSVNFSQAFNTDSNTAYGDSVEQSKAERLNNLSLSLFGEWVKDISMAAILQVKQHAQGPRLLPSDPMATISQDTIIDPGDLPDNFLCYVKPGSTIPKLQVDNALTVERALAAVGNIVQLQLADPKTALKFCESVYGCDFGDLVDNESEEACMDALEAMQTNLPMAKQMAQGMDPQMAVEFLASFAQIDPYDAHAGNKGQFWKDWLGKQQARKTDPLIIEAIHYTIEETMVQSAELGAGQQASVINAAQQVEQAAGLGAPPMQQGAMPNGNEPEPDSTGSPSPGSAGKSGPGASAGPAAASPAAGPTRTPQGGGPRSAGGVPPGAQ